MNELELEALENRLGDLLKDMDIPIHRAQDHRWLLRNMFIRNGRHPHFEESLIILKQLVKHSDAVNKEMDRLRKENPVD